jgi:hypothetical protein
MARGMVDDDRWLTPGPMGMSFSMYDDAEIRRLAAVEVTSPVTFDSLSNAVRA